MAGILLRFSLLRHEVVRGDSLALFPTFFPGFTAHLFAMCPSGRLFRDFDFENLVVLVSTAWW